MFCTTCNMHKKTNALWSFPELLRLSPLGLPFPYSPLQRSGLDVYNAMCYIIYTTQYTLHTPYY